MDQHKATELLEKYHKGTCTKAEKAAVEAWYNFHGHNTSSDVVDEDLELRKEFIWNLINSKNKKAIKLWPTLTTIAVAAVVLIVSGIFFFANPFSELQDPKNLLTATNDIKPGKNGATLTLGNGEVIQLSDRKNGVVIGDDKLAYSDGSSLLNDAKQSQKDLIANTTNGQTYQFTLPDGSKVWLNAASKLTVPSHFSSVEQRKVRLSGEAYFEVAKDKKRPFIVESDGQAVTVLGTHFNINSYADEGSVKTTLLEGSVKVSPLLHPQHEVMLKPNQQSILTGANQIVVKQADTENVMAWKNGNFSFNDESLKSIMRKLSRWYNIEVVYENDIDDSGFTGIISNQKSIRQQLKLLERTQGVHFKIEGRRVTVLK